MFELNEIEEMIKHVFKQYPDTIQLETIEENLVKYFQHKFNIKMCEMEKHYSKQDFIDEVMKGRT